MYKHDNNLFAASDIPAALGLLTRLPIIVDTEKALARGAKAAWAYPLVGVVLGVGIAALVPLLVWTGLSAGIIAALIIVLQVVLTGAMHEDGLADCADGFWGGWDRERRLAIMKDSSVGVYAVCALALALLLRWLSLVLIVSVGAYWMALIAVGALSRACMVLVMGVLPLARSGGLAHSVGRPPQGTVTAAGLIGVGAAILCGYPWLIVVAGAATLGCMLIAKQKINGQTGDVLGATQQISEVAMLITLTTMVI